MFILQNIKILLLSMFILQNLKFTIQIKFNKINKKIITYICFNKVKVNHLLNMNKYIKIHFIFYLSILFIEIKYIMQYL